MTFNRIAQLTFPFFFPFILDYLLIMKENVSEHAHAPHAPALVDNYTQMDYRACIK